MTVLATRTTSDGSLVGEDPLVQLGEAEPLGSGVKRVAMDQLEWGASGFFDGEDQFGRAIHQSRKAVKRVRSLLRLIRSGLTTEIFRYEDRSLRNTGRMITGVRTSAATVETAVFVRDIYAEFLAEETFEEMIERLVQRRDVIQLKTLEDPNLIARVVRNLERAYHRYASWPTDPDALEAYGMGIRDEYGSISPGLQLTYGRGRIEMVSAFTRSSSAGFHLWRKRVKYLRYQMEFLAPLWPEVIIGMALTLDRLGLVLGQDQDLRELQGLVQARPDLCPNPSERSLLFALVTQRRSELQLAAEIIGRRVYAEQPAWLEHRFGEYWASRQMEISRHSDIPIGY